MLNKQLYFICATHLGTRVSLCCMSVTEVNNLVISEAIGLKGAVKSWMEEMWEKSIEALLGTPAIDIIFVICMLCFSLRPRFFILYALRHSYSQDY